MGRVTRSTSNTKVTTRSRKSNIASSTNNKPQLTKKKVSVNKTSPLKTKRKRNAVDYAEVTLRKSTPQAKAKNLPIYKREVALVRENKVNDVFEFDLKEVEKAEKCNASYISDNEFDKDIQQDMKNIKKKEKKRVLTKKKETNKQKLLKTDINKSTLKVNKKQNASKNLKIKNKTPTKSTNSSGDLKQVYPSKVKNKTPTKLNKSPEILKQNSKIHPSKDLKIKKKIPRNSNNSPDALIQKENKVYEVTTTSIINESNAQSNKYSPKQIVVLENIICKSPSNIEDNVGTNISFHPSYSLPNFSDTSSNTCREDSNGTACNSPKDNTFKVPEVNIISSNIMNSPWRPNFIVRNSPRYMTTNHSNLPIYNQDAVINSTIIENSFQKGKNTKKSLKQKSMLDYVTGGAANEESFNCSLFDIDQLSPIKKVSNSPIVNKANSNKKVRRPLGLWNNNDAVSASQDDVDENSSLHFGFDKSDKENVPNTGKPTRYTGFEVKKRNIFAQFIEPTKKQDLLKGNTIDVQNTTVDDSLATQPVVGLFEDLETEPKAPPRASYGRKFPKRARFVEVEEEEEPEDDMERIKRRKKDQRTIAEEIAAKKWEDEFNKMCAEIDKHELEIEVNK
ncbi:PREDICTED: uncharacterized protein LOC108566168 [Nicrophorus vespilloides]|uniref:Uncharacterized protein LOC108566168 n=1 Tax=Nicrophorus vespilloides TaxID=110193 RepID=A0ABM1N3M4_NICVS|nr:PREDICTED: uncharacterized protein LOC108566168 [Nicrophorus vespilloides]